MAEYIISEEELNSMLDALGSPHIENGKEIIRCRNCAYSHKGTGRGLLCDYFEDANKVPALVTPNGFCAWAERDE